MDKDKLTAKRKDLEDGIAGLQAVITKANGAIQQAQANIFANQGAIQLIDQLLAEPPVQAADNVVPMAGDG